MDLTPKLIENGFAFISFLVIVVTFVWKVINILDRRMADIVRNIEGLVKEQHASSSRLADSVAHHDDRSQQRHDLTMGALHEVHSSLQEHHAAAIRLHEALQRRPKEGDIA